MALKSFLFNFNIWSFVIAFVLSFFTVKKEEYGLFKGWTISLMRWYFFWVLGVMGLWNFIAHVFMGGYTAQLMNWPQSPFQYEVGIANLIFCVLGFISYFNLTRPFQFASLIGFFVWFEGDAIGHFIRIYIKKTASFHLMGSYFFTDLILPLIGLLIFWISKPSGHVPPQEMEPPSNMEEPPS